MINNIKMQQSDVQRLSPRIAVIGVGGAGGNAVNNMISSGLEGCEFLVCNTDAQALEHSMAEHQVQLGVTVTGGLGAGSKPEIGQSSAEESLDEVLSYLEGANMAFVTAGMGGGTGTGAAPVIAKACRQQGILTVGVVTKPFHFEGVHRMKQAEKGIEEMQQYVDTLIVIPNQNLFRVANEKTTFAEAFKMADTVLQSGVRGVTDLMVRPGLVNLDFADIRTAMLQMGKAMMGTGEASGEKRATEAAEAAINNPLLDDVSMKGANGVIINVTGGYDMTFFEVDEACNRIRDEVDANANIIFGTTFDENMSDFMRVSIVATGIESDSSKSKAPVDNGTQSSSGDSLVNRNTLQQQNTTPVSSNVAAVQTQKSDANAAVSHSLSGRDVLKSLTAPMMRSAASHVPTAIHRESASDDVVASADVSSVDMFEQGEFVSNTKKSDEEISAPRGKRVGEAFIPPKPMRPDVPISSNGIGDHISRFDGAQESISVRPRKDVIADAAASPVVSPRVSPVLQTSSQESRHTPSLFERITGSVQQRLDNMRDEGDLLKAPTEEVSAKKPKDSQPSQGKLDIKTPSRQPSAQLDEDLDIPAFLRRQAN